MLTQISHINNYTRHDSQPRDTENWCEQTNAVFCAKGASCRSASYHYRTLQTIIGSKAHLIRLTFNLFARKISSELVTIRARHWFKVLWSWTIWKGGAFLVCFMVCVTKWQFKWWAWCVCAPRFSECVLFRCVLLIQWQIQMVFFSLICSFFFVPFLFCSTRIFSPFDNKAQYIHESMAQAYVCPTDNCWLCRN